MSGTPRDTAWKNTWLVMLATNTNSKHRTVIATRNGIKPIATAVTLVVHVPRVSEPHRVQVKEDPEEGIKIHRTGWHRDVPFNIDPPRIKGKYPGYTRNQLLVLTAGNRHFVNVFKIYAHRTFHFAHSDLP